MDNIRLGEKGFASAIRLLILLRHIYIYIFQEKIVSLQISSHLRDQRQAYA